MGKQPARHRQIESVLDVDQEQAAGDLGNKPEQRDTANAPASRKRKRVSPRGMTSSTAICKYHGATSSSASMNNDRRMISMHCRIIAPAPVNRRVNGRRRSRCIGAKCSIGENSTAMPVK
jgi:hypothetical protein